METKRELEAKDRLKIVLEELRYSANELSKELGYSSPSSVYHVLNGLNNLSTDMANKITTRFPEVSYLYLTQGKGSPLLTPKFKQAQANLFGSASQNVEQQASWDNIPTTLENIEKLLMKLVDIQEEKA